MSTQQPLKPDAPQPDPGEGWRLVSALDPKMASDGCWFPEGSLWLDYLCWSSDMLNKPHKFIYRRRIAAPADKWLDAATVKVPVETKAVYVGKPSCKEVFWWKWKPEWSNATILECGLTHWQPATIPEPPKAPEPVKSAEELAFGEWSKQNWLELDTNRDALRVWMAALAWRKANP